MLMIFVALLGFFNEAQAQVWPIEWDAATVTDIADACVLAENDPTASYTVSDGTSTLYAGSSLGEFLEAGNIQLFADASVLAYTADAEGEAAIAGYYNCMQASGVANVFIFWANTHGGLDLFDHDALDGTDAYTYAKAYMHEGVLMLQVSLDGNTGPCQSLYMTGDIFEDQGYLAAWAKWHRPASPHDKDFAKQSCSGSLDCLFDCELRYAPAGPPGGGDPFYFCLCDTGVGLGCSHSTSFTGPTTDWGPTTWAGPMGTNDGMWF
jgi:hypothetical protein